MKRIILFAVLVNIIVIALIASARLNTSGACPTGSCSIGNSSRTTDLTLVTDDSSVSLGVDGANVFLLTAETSSTAVFRGADAAGDANTLFDTTGAGTIVLGSADVTTLDLINNGAMTVGASTTDSVAIVTDGGTATIDGYVQADVGPFITLASGNLTANTIHLATAAATYTIPTCVAGNIGEWVTVIVQDISEVVILDLADASNTISAAGAIISTGHVIDSGGSATGDGDFITLVCVVAEIWYSTAIGGVWVDGGAT